MDGTQDFLTLKMLQISVLREEGTRESNYDCRNFKTQLGVCTITPAYCRKCCVPRSPSQHTCY